MSKGRCTPHGVHDCELCEGVDAWIKEVASQNKSLLETLSAERKQFFEELEKLRNENHDLKNRLRRIRTETEV